MFHDHLRPSPGSLSVPLRGAQISTWASLAAKASAASSIIRTASASRSEDVRGPASWFQPVLGAEVRMSYINSVVSTYPHSHASDSECMFLPDTALSSRLRTNIHVFVVLVA